MKFLGILIDHKLNFDYNVWYITSKLSRILDVLRKLSYYLPQEVLRTLYMSLVLPGMTCGIEVWYGG